MGGVNSAILDFDFLTGESKIIHWKNRGFTYIMSSKWLEGWQNKDGVRVSQKWQKKWQRGVWRGLEKDNVI